MDNTEGIENWKLRFQTRRDYTLALKSLPRNDWEDIVRPM